MGSLMAGWDSLNVDPKKVTFERNKSSTKEEIVNFWQSHKPTQHQHQHQQEHAETVKPGTSFDLPHFVIQGTSCPIDLDRACKTNDWWTRSTCAFLNEPPPGEEEEMNKSASNYAAQFHVASANKPTPAN